MSSRLGIILLPVALLLVAVAVDWASAGSAQPADASPSDSAPTEKAADQPDDSAAEGKAGFSRQQVLLSSLTIFVLAIFVGFEIITKVPPTLHTPLMSGSNAISGITLVGAVIVTGHVCRSRTSPSHGRFRGQRVLQLPAREVCAPWGA